MGKLLGKKGIRVADLMAQDALKIESISNKEIAVIGISGRFASKDDVSLYWEALLDGEDCIQPFHEERKLDTDRVIRFLGENIDDYSYEIGGFLKDIDKFDPAFFTLSPKEASLMDPNQRLFLQEAWRAIEDAGYGGNKLHDTRTGVFVGYSPDSDMEEDYRALIRKAAPDQEGLAVAGNLKSIIASRISYLLNLKGPSMTVDTACSSSLVAIHLACQSLRSGDVEMAIAGGVKISLMPLKRSEMGGIGIVSSDGRTRTFDDSSDGTGRGEGVGAVLLKPLDQAQRDGDHIYAVILGSSFNQDGKSNGITAPNPVAQADVIARAWKDADVDPETITYIEAHGTGTKLGDPIEIKGIQQAFRKFTARNQFCAISSVKSNLGHLDHAAGIAGFIKALLALKHKKLPPTANYKRPSRNISFEDSPVYVNDQARDWDSEGTPRRCGVSSFGLAGTNCHIVLQEAPILSRREGSGTGPHLFTLSAHHQDALEEGLSSLRRFIELHQTVQIADLCYTANTGRGHYAYRVALLVDDIEDLKLKLDEFKKQKQQQTSENGIYYGIHKVVGIQKDVKSDGELTETEQLQLCAALQRLLDERAVGATDERPLLEQICRLYVQGATIDWPTFYRGKKHAKLSLPTYPFLRQRCWLDVPQTGYVAHAVSDKSSMHPLIERLAVRTIDLDVYVTKFRVGTHWVLNEHRVGELYVAPGTTYIEMMRVASRYVIPAGRIELRDILFMNPLIVGEEETREVQTLIRKDGGDFKCTIISRQDEEEHWVQHAQATLVALDGDEYRHIRLDQLRSVCPEEVLQDKEVVEKRTIVTGPRWNNIKQVYMGEDEFLIQYELPVEYHGEIDLYCLHPALLDNAMNPILDTVGEGLYLPFFYKSLRVYGSMPVNFYGHLRWRDKKVNAEIARFDVTLFDEQGRVFAEAEDYAVKKVHETLSAAGPEPHHSYKMVWVQQECHAVDNIASEASGGVLVLMDTLGFGDQAVRQLREQGRSVTVVTQGEAYAAREDGSYIIGNSENDYKQLIRAIEMHRFSQIIHLFCLTNSDEPSDLRELEQAQQRGMYSLLYLTKALISERVRNNLEICIVGLNVAEVSGQEPSLHPEYATMFGLAKVIGQEHSQFTFRCIDIDGELAAEEILAEISTMSSNMPQRIAYRQGRRYVEQFIKVNLETLPDRPLRIKEDGVYIITGGFGALGLEMAKYIASKAHVHLVLLGRSKMPEQDQWSNLLTKGENERICRIIRTLQDIEKGGSDITCCSVDVSSQQDLQLVVGQLRARFGHIDGVIHAAGVAGDGFLMRKEEAVFNEVIRPKVHGTWLMDYVTLKDQLDFFIVFSSITSLFGGFGQADYTAANSYLDAFAEYRSRRGAKTLAINWAAWKEIGMAVEYGANEDGIFKTITTSNALKLLDQCLQKECNRIVLAEINAVHEYFADDTRYPLPFSVQLRTEIERSRKRLTRGQSAHESVERQVEFVLTGRDDQKYTDTERFMAAIWAEVFGLQEVDIYDDFYQLGGDSILGLRLVNTINERSSTRIDISDIFMNTTIAQISKVIEGNRGESASISSTEELAEVSIADREPLIPIISWPASLAQQRLWFMHLFAPEELYLRMPVVLRLTGQVDPQRFHQSVNELIRQQEMLRSRFVHQDETLMQIVLPATELSIPIEDLRGKHEQEKEEHIKQQLHEMQDTLDPDNGPLFLARLLQVNDDEHWLLFVLHRLIADDSSINVLVNEWLNHYQSIIEGTAQESADSLEVQDFIEQEPPDLDGFGNKVSYWKEHLGGELPILQLPTDYPRPAIQSYRGEYLKFELPNDMTNALSAFSDIRGVTLSAMMFAAYVALLHRYSSQEDICIGIHLPRHTQHKWERLIGHADNTLVIRAGLANEITFNDLIQQLQISISAAGANSDVPFEKLIDLLSIERDMSRSPLFQAMFDYGSEQTEWETDGMKLRRLNLESPTISCDLKLKIIEEPNKLKGQILYSSAIFKNSTISRLLGHYVNILLAGIQNPEQPIGMLPMITETEREHLLVEFNRTTAVYPMENHCLHEMIEAQRLLTPLAPAVTFEGQTLTYTDLEHRTNQLARFLRDKGVEADTLIGICMERSVEMVIGLLGILKAGGAYVPLDPTNPQDRLAYMITDANPAIVLTQERFKGRVSLSSDRVICLDSNWDQVSQQSTDPLKCTATSENLAYMIYTSGSTGKPKGVLNTHRGIVNRLLWMQDTYQLTEEDRVLQKTPFGFDVSVWEFFWPLMTGACLVVALPEGHKDAAYLAELIKRERITTIHFVPSMLQVFLEEEHLEGIHSLKRVFCSGEALSYAIQKRFYERFKTHLYNLYGPTEAAVDVTHWTCKQDSPLTIVPIGKPIANTQIYILDKYLNPVPIGMPGELHIGGVQLARGYHNRSDLTDEKFITHSFGNGPGIRLYKTGDMARYIEDGSIEYLGRMDFMVKIRGFRIELGEIEACLLDHPGVREALVIAREDVPGDQRLVAYICGAEAGVTEEELKHLLNKQLPVYMIPSAFVFLPSLPLTLNGKIDRKALPSPLFDRDSFESTYIAPRNATEAKIVDIWKEVLRQEDVGVKDNFFNLGGHSLLATQVITRLRKIFKTEISIPSFFADPTVEALGQRVAESKNLNGAFVGMPLERVSRDQTIPLSNTQLRLWFLHQLDPNSIQYNIPIAMRLHGKVDYEIFEQCINEIVRRHESLRTVFQVKNGIPEQIIFNERKLTMKVIDLSTMAAEEQEDNAVHLLTLESKVPFDMERGPLLRTAMIRMNDEEHMALFVMHHIISDGWSTGLLILEMASLYGAFSTNQPSPLPELAIQYADYSMWQHERMQGEVFDKQLSYWKEKLSGHMQVLEMPTDRPRHPVTTQNGAILSFNISKVVTERLKRLGKEHGATLFMTLLAAYQTLLYRYTGQEDISVGTPIAVRNRPELEDLIGFLVNTLVMRTDLSGQPTFVELLHRVREVALGAYAHQEVPFEKLAEELQPERDMSRSLFFQTLFVLQNMPVKDFYLDGLSMEMVPIDKKSAMFEISITLLESNGHIEGKLEYNTDLYNAASIERFIQHYLNLLDAIIINPNQLIAHLNLLSEEERNDLLLVSNSAAKNLARTDVCVHHLFEEQVQRTPHHVAVEFREQKLSYAELDAKANRMANYLRKKAVKPGKLVGISMERSMDMLVGLLGILKAGGAYVPLDPNYPKERLAYILKDSSIELLITQHKLAHALPIHEAECIYMDTDWEIIQQESDEPCHSEVTGDHQMYMIYTSGSTGTPKGVVVSHRSVVNHNRAIINEFQLQSNDRVFQFASISFDVAVEEIFPTLLSGAALVLWEDDYLDGGSAFLHWVTQKRLTVLNLPTAYWHTWVSEIEHLPEPLPDKLRLVVVGGEKASSEIYKAWREKTQDGVKWFNAYGPTEATITATLFKPDGEWIEGQPIPIGKPLENVEIYILDAFKQLVPVGVPGELYIGGVCLASGYWNRTELTKERFVQHPFTDNSDDRLYKTGDLVRRLPDGNLEFLGRTDNQVKIRGFRIELGEIEAVIEKYPSMDKAVVVALHDISANLRLVAYVVVQGNYFDAGELRDFLKKNLPGYMIPAVFVQMETLPLTANGKVDYRALPQPQEETREDENFVIPRTMHEEMIAEIWREVLLVTQVGAYDNFFELGGHSLLATQVAARLQKALQLTIPLRLLFEAPTVEELARRLESMRDDSLRKINTDIGYPALDKAEHRDPEELSFAQQRLWLMDRLLSDGSVYNIPHGLRLQGFLDIHALEKSIYEIVRRHEALRTVFVEVDGQPKQQVSAPDKAVLSIIEVNTSDDFDDYVKMKAKEEVMRQFDLKQGPLIRFLLLRRNEHENVLLMNMHHIIGDGWSMGILMKELFTLYEAFEKGEESPLTELPIQYADFARWQRDWLQGEVLNEQLAYWKKQLGDSVPVLQLPTDRPRPSVQSYRGATEMFTLPHQLTEDLRILSQKEGVTLFMTLLAAFQTLLYRYTGQEEISVGTPIAGRTLQETEGLIGCFVNTLVMFTKLEGNPTFKNLLRRVRDVALDAYSNQDVPFELLVEKLVSERNLSQSPLFQVMFVLNNTLRAASEASNLNLGSVEFEAKSAKFDLTLSMSDSGEILMGYFEYSTDLFNKETIQSLVVHFQTLLHHIIENPEQKITELPILSQEERNMLQFEWNDTKQPYPQEASILTEFEKRVEEMPDAVAVIWDDQRLSYSELNRKANQIANYLCARGLQSESLVGIAVDRSPSMIIGLLGILKAGGAYLPIDPNYPAERIAYMLEVSHATLLLSQKHLLNRLPQGKRDIVCFDEIEEAFAGHSSATSPIRLAPENLAYVIYTSGSTGLPKGVAIRHRNVVALIYWALSVYDGEELAGVLAATSICFDLSVFEIFVTLSAGGSIVLAEHALQLSQLKAREQVTLINTVPSAISELLESGCLPESARTINLAGEPLRNHLVKKLYALEHVDKVYNLYGPSEDTTYSTYALMPKQSEQTPSIGRPISNTQLYVLDAWKQPVPVGVTGELYIGGEGVARGYLYRPDLTDEKFVADPFSAQAERKLYRTGDLVRFLRNGDLEYIGRIDHQVKIRGFRIELGEIEECLLRNSSVKEALVMVREDVPGDKQLTAYIVAGDDMLTTANLREALRKQLPDYMIPNSFVQLEEFPLTPNGKLDRKALPVPGKMVSHDYVAPQNDTEALLAEIWSQVLRREDIGTHDNFFELGGHSLKAMIMISHVNKAFHVDLSLREVFRSPTIGELALAIHEGKDQTFVAIESVQQQEHYPLSVAQRRMLIVDQMIGNSIVYNIPIVFRVEGELDAGRLADALQKLVQRHESLRTTFHWIDGEPVQIVHKDMDLKLEHQTSTEDSLIEQIRLQIRPFDLGAAPPLRAALFDLEENVRVLLIDIHHIVTDGTSNQLLIRDLIRFYQGEELPPLPIQYKDFAIWQLSEMQSDSFMKQQTYWLDALGGELPILDLPTDFERLGQQSFDGGVLTYFLSDERVHGLRQLLSKTESTLFMVLLAIFQVTLGKYSRQDDILVGTPIAGRRHAEIQEMVGMFVNTLVIRSHPTGTKTFEEFLAEVKQTVLTAFDNQDYPYEQLVNQLNYTRIPNRNPLFDVMFAMENEYDLNSAAESASFKQLTIDTPTTKFDLMLTVSEHHEGIRFEFRYCSKLFTEATIELFCESYLKLLEAVVHQEKLLLKDIELAKTEVLDDLLASGVEFNF